MARDGLRFLGSEFDNDNYAYEESMVLNKAQSTIQYVSYMLNRTARMFEYEGLPDTIPDYMLELYLQMRGVVGIARAETLHEQYRLDGSKSGLYCFYGTLGGPPDIYLRPTMFIAANPALKQSLNLVIGKDCEIIKNDTRAIGLMPMFTRYAQQMSENDISLRSAQINSRQRTIISAQTDREHEAAEEYINQLEAGEFAILAEDAFLEGVKITSAGSAAPNTIIQLIELQQYLKASWFNEIGINTNFNMKREYLSAEEIAANTDVLLPLVDDMLYCREKALERINSMFGTNITVKKASSWDNKARESEAELKNMEDGGEDAYDSQSESNDSSE